MITTPAGIQILMEESREELIARVLDFIVKDRKRQQFARVRIDDAESTARRAEIDMRIMKTEIKDLRERERDLRVRLDRVFTILDVLVKTGQIDERTAGILRDDDNSI